MTAPSSCGPPANPPRLLQHFKRRDARARYTAGHSLFTVLYFRRAADAKQNDPAAYSRYADTYILRLLLPSLRNTRRREQEVNISVRGALVAFGFRGRRTDVAVPTPRPLPANAPLWPRGGQEGPTSRSNVHKSFGECSAVPSPSSEWL